jgi:hypothetical protein
MDDADRPEIDFLILADRAEAVNGKVYMMGGGWDRIQVPDFSSPQSISLAIGVLVPWNATNRNYNLKIRIESEDATELAAMEMTLNTGRPPNLGLAESQRVVLAFNLQLKIPSPGTYVINGFIDDGLLKRVVFYARPLPSIPRALMKSPE